ncbi:MAG: tRNA (adenosine(37)-N6)-dimethylallyltransferase MiaA [Bacteroidaceae bacterium]|nr:tRNA (adenosine(37)-N6)-dimethylallyltransferase MiaA [Bacteroidaceae bacterium]
MTCTKNLVVILGPTGVGKTELCLSLAVFFHSPIISADSRQIYSDIPIGTAAPTMEEQKKVKHYFIGTLKLDQYYSAAKYEEEAMELLTSLFTNHDILLATGGSMMYIDALCNGIDDIPTITEDVRQAVIKEYHEVGLDAMFEKLCIMDPEYGRIVDCHNPKRVLHALEICTMTGTTYSSLRKKDAKQRDFNIIKIGLTRPREELYERINRRVDMMIENGLVEEAMRVLPYRNCNSLNTVGFKEMFQLFDGAVTPEGEKWTLEYAADKIKRSTRIYSRKQMTWFKRDKSIKWFHPSDEAEIIKYIQTSIRNKGTTC